MLFGLATGARAQPDGSVASNGRLPYRVEGPDRYKVMTLATDEFIRRFLIHVLPKGFHRIRHYGLFAKPLLCRQHRSRSPTARDATRSDRQCWLN